MMLAPSASSGAAMRRAIRPYPTRPTVRVESRRMGRKLSMLQVPDRTESLAIPTWKRGQDQGEGVGGDLLHGIVGTFVMMIPASAAAPRSTLSKPIPYRAMIRHFSRRAIESAVQGRYVLRMASASAAMARTDLTSPEATVSSASISARSSLSTSTDGNTWSLTTTLYLVRVTPGWAPADPIFMHDRPRAAERPARQSGGPPMTDKVRLGAIGTGRWGSELAEAVAKTGTS